MFKRNITGIYLETDALHYLEVRAPRWGAQWYPRGLEVCSAGRLEGSAPALLSDFLEKLSAHPPHDICLALPRSVFSARDVLLPPMPLEDALQAVQSGMALHSHLPVEEIYYDIHLCRVAAGKINALIFYAPRKVIDAYRDIFQKTGHQEQLKAIFPVSYGIASLLLLPPMQYPAGLIMRQGENCELTVLAPKGCLHSMTSPCGDREARALLIATARSKFHLAAENIIEADDSASGEMPVLPQSRLKPLPPFTENPAVAALAPVLCGWQQLSIDDQPTRLKMFRPLRAMIAGSILLALLLALLTLQADKAGERKKREVAALKVQIRQLQKELQPLEEQMAILRHSAQSMEDIEAFMQDRPPLFSYVNEIARLVPEDTWFSRLNFSKEQLSLRGQSKDALKVVDALRQSRMFESVKLQGSVSRTGRGEDRFALTIQLKKTDETDKEQP